MDWQDLQLPADAEAELRSRRRMSPEQVVALAWGSPDQLSGVVPAPVVARLRDRWPQSAGARFDSSDFALGARLGMSAAAPSPADPEFEARRRDLVSRLDAAGSAGERDALESALVALYKGDAGGPR